ncbi:MAG: hypothetical protein R3F60_25175 [bacterium]
MRCLLLALLALLPSLAQAQFSALDRQRLTALAGGRLDYADPGNGAALRGEIYGQTFFRGIGVYGQVPLSYYAPEGGDAETALGNLELGIFGTTGAVGRDIILRAGLSLATSDGSGPAAAVNLANQWPRLTDRVNHLPDTTALRLSASPRFGGGRFFAQADLGGDITFPPGDAQSAVLLRANIALGLYAGPVRISAEFINISRVDGLEKEGGDAFYNQFVASVRHGMLYAALGIPLDEDVDLITVGAGLEWTLGGSDAPRRRVPPRRRYR